MKAIRVHEFGDAGQLIYEEAPVPEPGPGEVRVKVKAIGLNFADIYQRRGWYPNQTPFSPGTEFAGVVDKLGEGVTGLALGDRVGTASGRAAYAEYAVAPAMQVAKLAGGVTFDQAAALLEQGPDCPLPGHLHLPAQTGRHGPGARRRRRCGAAIGADRQKVRGQGHRHRLDGGQGQAGA